MDGDSRSSMLPWIIAVILLLFAAYFAVAETAFASASRNKIKTAADKGDGRAERLCSFWTVLTGPSAPC